MNDFQIVVVGTDGSDSSLRAVDRAAQLASKLGAKLILATAYIPAPEATRAASMRKGASYRMSGDADVYRILQKARERAEAAGATNLEEKPIVGNPADALVKLAEDAGADLLVVGNLGLNSITGRLVGSIPALVSRRSKVDVLIVHTTG